METEQQNIRQVRQRSSRRLRYEAESEIFKTKFGDLEEIRKRLELRPAQICRLLKVHPSAWIRWNRTRKAPPHVFQMLEWYLELQKAKGLEVPPIQIPVTPVPLVAAAHSEPSRFWKQALILSWIIQLASILVFFAWAHKFH